MSKARKGSKPDPQALLARFSNAKAEIDTGCVVLEQLGDRGPEMVTIRTGLNLLNAAYDDLDRAIMDINAAWRAAG